MFIRQMNQDIWHAKGSIPRYVISNKLGISENTLYNWMKQEMTEDKKMHVLQAIAEIKAEMERVAQ